MTIEGVRHWWLRARLDGEMSTDLPDDWFRPATESGELDQPAGVPAAAPRHGVSPQDPIDPPSPAPIPIPRPTSAVETSGSLPAIRESDPNRQPWLWRHAGLVTVLTLALALAVGLGMGALVSRRTSDPAASPGTPSSAAPATTTAIQPWSGPVVALSATTVRASCVAPSIRDGQGGVISYEADHVLDPSVDTAWRCNGSGVGQSLTFSFAAGVELAGVGIVNGNLGQVKGQSQYMSTRRITAVTWTLPTGEHFTQNLSENSPVSQQVLIPPTRVNGPLTLTITASTAEPKSQPGATDAVMISQVTFYAPQR